jgi:hypothetical protein
MLKPLFLLILLLFISHSSISQSSPGTASSEHGLVNYDKNGLLVSEFALNEPKNNWSINVLFSDNGYGLGGTIFKTFNKDFSGFASVFFTSAKDDREFDVTDIYGNTYTPNKINRLFMIPLNLGLQYRLFREDVTDNLRPFINGGITPTAILYAPYNKSIIPSLGYLQAKYTVGGFIGVGMDYLTSRSTGVSANVRYYYIKLFGDGIQSLQDKPKNYFGGLYFVFSFNFMK